MKEFGLMLGLLSFVLISRKSSVIGRTLTPFVQSSIVVGPSAEVTVSARQESIRQYNNTRQETETKSFFKVTSYRRETTTTTTKRNEYSFTNASSKQLLPALSVTLVSRSLLNDFIKSSLSTNVQPESFAPRYPSLNEKDSVSSSHENSFAISSTLYNVLAAEIIPTTSQVNGLSKASSTRDKAHLSTSQKEDKSRDSSQEAFIKSAFFDPRGVSNVFNSWTAQFTSSMSQGDSLYSTVVSKNETKMFTKGSVALTNGLRTSSPASTIRKTAELKLLSQAASHSSFRKETYQHSVKTFDTKITSEAIREQFAGISGISKTTENGKLTLIYEGFTSSFISTVLATGVYSTSIKTSSTSRPPSIKQHNVSLYLSVMTSPVVLNKMSTNSMTTSTTPLPHMSVSGNSSKVSSRSKSEFHTSSMEKKSSDVLSLSSNSTQTSDGGESDVSTHESISSVVPKESLRSSDLSDFVGRSSYLTEGMQTAPFSRPKTSQQTYLLSTSLVKAFSGSVDIPQNAGKQTPVSSKQSTALGENLSSSSLLHTTITMRSKLRSVSDASNYKHFSKLMVPGSSHPSSISSSIDYRVRFSQFTNTSAVSNGLVVASSRVKDHRQISQIASSTHNIKFLVGVSSSLSLPASIPPSASIVSMSSRFSIPNQSGTIYTDTWYRRSHLSSQSSTVSSELVVSSSSTTTTPSPLQSQLPSKSSAPPSPSFLPSLSPSSPTPSSTQSSRLSSTSPPSPLPLPTPLLSTSPSSSSSSVPSLSLPHSPPSSSLLPLLTTRSPSSSLSSPSRQSPQLHSPSSTPCTSPSLSLPSLPSSPQSSSSLSSSSSSSSTLSTTPSPFISSSLLPSSLPSSISKSASPLSTSLTPSPSPPQSPSSLPTPLSITPLQSPSLSSLPASSPLSTTSPSLSPSLSSPSSSPTRPLSLAPPPLTSSSSPLSTTPSQSIPSSLSPLSLPSSFRSLSPPPSPRSSLPLSLSSLSPPSTSPLLTTLSRSTSASLSPSSFASPSPFTSPSPASPQSSSSSSSSPPPSPSSSSSSSSSTSPSLSSTKKIVIQRYSSVTGFYYEPSLSKSNMRSKVFLSSHQSSTLFTEEHSPSSSWQTFSKTQQDKSSYAREIHRQSVTKSSGVTHQSNFLSSNSSVVSAKYVTTSSLPAMVRSKIPRNISSSSTPLYKEPRASSSVTAGKSRLFSTQTSFTPLYLHSFHGLVTSYKLGVASTGHIPNSFFKTQRHTPSIITSGLHERLPASTSKIGHQPRSISTESSTTSLDLHAHSRYQTPHTESLVLTLTYQPMPSTLESAHQVNFSSPQTSLASTVSPSSQPKISSHVLQRRSSAELNLPFTRPILKTITTSVVYEENMKGPSLDSSGASPVREITSAMNVPRIPAPSIQLGTTVPPKDNMSTSSPTDVAGHPSTEQPTSSIAEVSNIKLLVIVATVPSIVLCIFFVAVMFFRRNRKRKNNFKYSIKLEYMDSLRSRCANSRLDLSLKEIHIDLEMPNLSNDRRDSIDCSRGTSLTGTQIRELQILSQECKENLEWISEVIARDMGTSMCPRQPVNRDSVYSVKEKGSYEPSAKIIRRESSKRGRETIKWRVPIKRRRDSGEFDQNDSVCTEDTTLTSEWKDDREVDGERSKSVDKSCKIRRTPSHLSEDRRGPVPSKKLGELQEQEKDRKETELDDNRPSIDFNFKKEEKPHGKRSGKRFETF